VFRRRRRWHMLTAPTVLGVFGALLCASVFGVNLQRKLAEHHKSRETGDHVRLIISILVTFTAVVLGLLISNVKSSYDQFDSRLRTFAADITELDVRLREYGDDAAPIRAKLRTYVAASIADTWRSEPAPSGVYPKFGAISGLVSNLERCWSTPISLFADSIRPTRSASVW
jgi:hypothetical protein